MATFYPYPDSRALFSVAIGARKGVYEMNNLQKAIEMLESNKELAATVDRLNRPTQPPMTLKDIIDAIATRRGVSLYR